MSFDLQALLDAREARWLRRLKLCEKGALLTLTMNAPGPEKNLTLWNDAHHEITVALKANLKTHLLFFEEYETPAGAESHFATDLDGAALKRYAVRLEEEHPIGRLLDADVMDQCGEPIGREDLGLPPRLCLCCEREAKCCSRERRHSSEEVLRQAEGLLTLWRRADSVIKTEEC